MNVSPLLSLPTDTAAMQASAGRAGEFKKLLAQSAGELRAAEKKAEIAEREKDANEAATGLVSNALILPILQQFRRSQMNMEGPFSPGKAEKAFGPQFDMQIADRIAQSPKLGIKTALVNRLMRRGTPAAQTGMNVHG